jgi:hypothetical protein
MKCPVIVFEFEYTQFFAQQLAHIFERSPALSISNTLPLFKW